MINFVLASIFFGTIFIVFSIWSILRNIYGNSASQAHKRLEFFSRIETQEKHIPVIFRSEEFSEIPLFNRLLEKIKITDRLSGMLLKSGVNLRVGQVLLLMITLGTLGSLLTIMRGGGFFLNVIAFAIMAYFPVIYLSIKKSKRLKSFMQKFPDAIDMMASALKAGHAFNKAMQLVSMEAPEPVGTEFKKTFEENNLGLPIKEALINLTARVESTDLQLFVMAVILQRETGGNLTEVLDKISFTIRERFKLLGQMKVYTAQGRMSMWIIGGLPMAFALLVSMINPEYLKPLYQERSGQLL
ncbi:type II secretion system F family protein, partial [bacterium]|nr:type II secretion system F family protein [candidate division CSSED10-310 bacterium]